MKTPSILSIALVGTLLSLLILWRSWRRFARADYIRTYTFPPGLFEKLAARHPGLTPKEFQLIARGLRQFFLAHLKSGRRYVSMPSQAADDLWHEFILYTRHYAHFCQRAFGRFMHHTPAVVLGPDRQTNAGLRRCWWFCCREENINPRRPTRLPLLFALDTKLNIPNGFRYAPNCRSLRENETGSPVHCGGDFGDGSFASGGEGFGDISSSDGDSGGDGDGGCGGGD
jgi:hypothetical protein